MDDARFQQVTMLSHALPNDIVYFPVSLSRYFPRDQPIMTFQSSYHLNRRNQLFQVTSTNYPYSPRWSGVEMAKRAK